MTVLWDVFRFPLEQSTTMKEDLIMAAVFFVMFFLIYGGRDLVVKHLPRKEGSILDEILNETWDSYDEDEDEEVRTENPESCAAEQKEEHHSESDDAPASDAVKPESQEEENHSADKLNGA